MFRVLMNIEKIDQIKQTTSTKEIVTTKKESKEN